MNCGLIFGAHTVDNRGTSVNVYTQLKVIRIDSELTFEIYED